MSHSKTAFRSKPGAHRQGKREPNTRNTGRLKGNLERYLELARSAAASGDKIAAEDHYQHAEHYLRLMNADAS